MTATNLGLGGQPVRFLGAYVSNVNAQLGLAQSASTCSVTLVEDLNQSPQILFNEPEVGSYQELEVSSFGFQGVVTSWSKDVRNIGGRQITVSLSDPREIMTSIPMILAPGFRGVVAEIANSQCSVLDIFGAYDDPESGYNLSDWNQAGIPYERIALALKGGTVFLSSIQFDVVGQVGKAFGERYRFNLDALSAKVADPTFRINSNLISIADFVQEMANRNSLDWYVTSERAADNIIDVTINVIDRSTDNISVDLDDFLAAASGRVVSARRGFELRNDVACAVLFGAPVEQMRTLNITGLANNPVDLSDEGASASYFMTEEEMRYVLGNKQAWKLWLAQNGGLDRYNVGGIQQALGLPIVSLTDFAETQSQLAFRPDRIRPGKFPNQEKKIGAIYEKLKGHAEATYGKRFLFQLPTDADIIDSAWTADAISGNDNPNEYFRKEDGKTRCYIEFVQTTDLVPTPPQFGFTLGKGQGAAQALTLNLASSFDIENSVVEADKADWMRSAAPVNGVTQQVTGNRLYVAATIEEGGIVRIDSPITQAAPTSREVQKIIQAAKPALLTGDADGNNVAKAKRSQILLIHIHGEYPNYTKIHTQAYQPRYVHVPVRSKFVRYGPVFSSSIGPDAQGALKIEQDDGFSPWEFGGASLMTTAMQFKVDNESSNVKKVENATIVVEGFPDYTIGEALGFNSNINNINISLQGQVTTTYELRSFLRKFGELSKRELAQLSLFARRGGARNIPQDTLAFINKYRSKIARQFAGRGSSSTSALSEGALSFE